MTEDSRKCHWVKDEDGFNILIPGCWNRIHDPDAVCLCGVWSEGSAAETIRALRAAIYREKHRNQALSAALRIRGIADPTTPAIETPKQYNARQRRRTLHRAITEAGQSATDSTTP